MEELKRKLWREVEEVANKPEIGVGDLELLHKLTDTIKNIDKICMLEDDEYSQDGGYSGRARHYVRGHYSRDGGGNGGSYGGRYGSRGGSYSGRRGGGYSRDGGREEMLRHLEAAMDASPEEDREAVRRLMEKVREM